MSLEGWRDVWNFVDLTLREIETAEYIEGLRVVKENGITFGTFTVDDVVIDTWPYWAAWAEFDISCGLIRSNPDINKFSILGN